MPRSLHQTGTGICHVYVDAAADLEMAVNIVENAKTSRPSVCNARRLCWYTGMWPPQFLPMLKQRLVDDRTAAGADPGGTAPGRPRRGYH